MYTIPKIIHQTWKTTTIPEKWKRSQEAWISLYPGWTYKLWTDIDNLELVDREFPQYSEMFKNFEYDIQRADFIRYVILYKYGGIYSDLDIVPLQPFTDSLFGNINSDVYLMRINTYLPAELSLGNVTNALMISKKGSVLWLEIMREVEIRFLKPRWYWFLKHEKVLSITGPRMFQYVIQKYKYPITTLPNNVTLCSICDKEGTVVGENPYIMSIEGQSWNSLDTKIINFLMCNFRFFILIITLFIFYFIFRFYKYKKFCQIKNCKV
jgi:mannosyltransferase OCH1-like enzyme